MRGSSRRTIVAWTLYDVADSAFSAIVQATTVILFAAVFASKTLGFSATEIIGLFLVVQVTALIGSALWARPTDTRGPRFVVTVTLVQWVAVTVLAFFVQAKWEFWLVAVLAGTGLGAVQAASRTGHCRP